MQASGAGWGHMHCLGPMRVGAQGDMQPTCCLPLVAAWAPFPSLLLCPSPAAARSYNKVNNEPACLSKTLLTTTLRQKLGFKGFVATDCDGELLAAAPCLWLFGGMAGVSGGGQQLSYGCTVCQPAFGSVYLGRVSLCSLGGAKTCSLLPLCTLPPTAADQPHCSTTPLAALEGYAKPAPEGMGYGDLRSISAQALRAGSDQACKVGSGHFRAAAAMPCDWLWHAACCHCRLSKTSAVSPTAGPRNGAA